MEQSFSNRIKEVISYSREEALRLGHAFIGTWEAKKYRLVWNDYS